LDDTFLDIMALRLTSDTSKNLAISSIVPIESSSFVSISDMFLSSSGVQVSLFTLNLRKSNTLFIISLLSIYEEMKERPYKIAYNHNEYAYVYHAYLIKRKRKDVVVDK